jgi:hypothetical protein
MDADGSGPLRAVASHRPVPEKEPKIVFVRMQEFEQNMTATLAHIKKLAES